MKLLGTVKWYDQDRGFGFLTHDGQDVFVHAKDVRPKGGELIAGQTVTYVPRSNPKGIQASEVCVIEVDGNV